MTSTPRPAAETTAARTGARRGTPLPDAGAPAADPAAGPAADPAAASPAGGAVTPLPPGPAPQPIGRIPVIKLQPVVEGGVYAAKAFAGERIPIRATVFREGHDSVAAAVVLTAPDGTTSEHRMAIGEPAGFSRYEAWVRPDQEGAWTFRVEAWDDPWETWLHHAEIKIPAGIDTGLVCAEGAQLFTAAAAHATGSGDAEAAELLGSVVDALQAPTQVEARLAAASTAEVRHAMLDHAPRPLLTATGEHPIFVDRRAAGFASWYEFFPRSQGAEQLADGSWRSGTFASSYERLEAAAAMGFDVIYLPPIHPIGRSFRKGPNNTLTPGEHDPGSPWAIGAAEGGHDTIHPDLGTEADFVAFIAKARELGLEVAMDFALQASPDHPWVTEHPEWFTERVDGSIAYAENPPKKYQDIYPINFDRDPAGIYHESLRILRRWMDLGIRTFRVDNPHTKPVDFWAWITAEVRRTDPDVVFLSEAFTKPEMMWALGKVGYHQSYTYFTWRNTAAELTEYLTELSRETDAFVRPNFFVNTPDILPTVLQHGGRAAFTIRAVLGATLAPLWGVYSGFELFEGDPIRPGAEEYLNSEKFQYRPRDFAAAEANGDSLSVLITRLNALRREHAALQQLRMIDFHPVAGDGDILVFSKQDDDTDGLLDRVIVACSLDPHRPVTGEVTLDLVALGLPPQAVLDVRDELTGAEWQWGARNYLRLTPEQPAHVLAVTGLR